MSTKKEYPVCDRCGSPNVSADAAARWDHEKQDWAVTNVFDKGHSCDDCGDECKIEWKEGDPPDLDIKRPVPEHHQQWFETLTRAFKEGNVALMTCGSPNGVRTVICMVNRQHDGGAEFLPVGEMCEANNPFEHYIPPFKDEEDGS